MRPAPDPTLPGLDVPATPVRLYFNRFEGKRLSPNAKLVTRGTRWGNPFPAAKRTPEAHALVVDQHRQWLRERPEMVTKIRRYLAGWSLACTCPIGWPCHADTLLAVANGEEP